MFILLDFGGALRKLLFEFSLAHLADEIERPRTELYALVLLLKAMIARRESRRGCENSEYYSNKKYFYTPDT